MTIRDQSGAHVRMICRDGCRRGQTVRGVLQRSPRRVVQPTEGEESHRYAGHVAVCPHCGYEATDCYNGSAAT